MWTEQHRKIYQRFERRYPSDMTDSEWARLEPLIPPAKPGGRPRETNMGGRPNGAEKHVKEPIFPSPFQLRSATAMHRRHGGA
jgi:transposase